MAAITAPEVTVTVTRSAGDDRAVLVFIDTTFEPDASDGGPGLRVLVNDNEAYAGKAYDLGANHEAGAKTLAISLDDIPYVVDETPQWQHANEEGVAAELREEQT